MLMADDTVSATALWVPRCSPAANVQLLISSTGATTAETTPHHGRVIGQGVGASGSGW